MITGYDHVQVAMSRGGEDAARGFYGELLGLTKQPKPPSLAARDPFGNRLEFQQA